MIGRTKKALDQDERGIELLDLGLEFGRWYG
jgi:hypothetical protein